MNFNITRHTPIRKKKRKVTKETDLVVLAAWARSAWPESALEVAPAHPDYAALRKLKGFVRIDGKWKAFVAVHADHISVLHCGDTPTLL